MSDIYAPTRLKILFIPQDNKGCGFYRMMVPANEMIKQDLADVVINFGWDWKLVQWADLIVIQRESKAEALEAIDQAHSIGKKVIYEVDDLLQLVSPWNPAYPFWSPMGPNLARALKLMEKCDAMQVSTPRLRNEYGLYNPVIEAMPNYLDKQLWDTPAWTATHWDNYYKKKNDGVIRIGWAGAGSHYHDIQLIEEIITKICQKYPQVHFVMMGYFGESNRGKNLFQDIASNTSVCAHCKEAGQLEKVSGIDLLYYPSKLKECAFDIAVAPITETGFNEGKSDLKIKEYAALGVPVVASNITPYKESVSHGHTGFLATTGKEWFDSLELLIKDEELRKKMGNNNHKWYEQNTIDKHIHEWVRYYQRVVSVSSKW